MRQVHNVVIIPFMKSGVRCLLVKSGIPQNTLMLIQGSSVEEVMHSFFIRYGHEILSSIRHGRVVFFSIAEPTGVYWALAYDAIRSEGLKGRFTFYPLHELEYVGKEITRACQHEIIPVP
jgi:hypothetical protein